MAQIHSGNTLQATVWCHTFKKENKGLLHMDLISCEGVFERGSGQQFWGKRTSESGQHYWTPLPSSLPFSSPAAARQKDHIWAREGQDEREKSWSLLLKRLLFHLCRTNRRREDAFFLRSELDWWGLGLSGCHVHHCTCVSVCLCSFLSVTAKAELSSGSCSFRESMCDYTSDPSFLSWTLDPSGECQQPVHDQSSDAKWMVYDYDYS